MAKIKDFPPFCRMVDEREGIELYKLHESFNLPEDEDLKIWRFMDLSKFLDLIVSQSLYFTRADKFRDVYDGRYSNYSKATETNNSYMYESFNNTIRANSLISCWHMNEYESAAMWDLYIRSGEGVAVQSTIKKLKDSFGKTPQDIFIGKVNYIDFETESNFSNQGFEPILSKRKSFNHESEIRAVFNSITPKTSDSMFAKPFVYEHGVNLKVDLEILIDKVYIYPDAEVWFVEMLKNIVGKLDLNFEVIKSTLYDLK